MIEAFSTQNTIKRIRPAYRAHFLKYFRLNPEGDQWYPLSSAIIYTIHCRDRSEGGDDPYDWSYMVMFIREFCFEAGLRYEIRPGAPPIPGNIQEGFYGLERI